MQKTQLFLQDSESDESLHDQNDTELVLQYLLAHTKAPLQAYLRSRGLPFSGTKQSLRDRLETYLRESLLTLDDLVSLLDSIEAWGNQHVYLYQAPRQLCNQWSDEAFVLGLLRSKDMDSLYNRKRPLILPDAPVLSSILRDPARLRILWVEKRQWEERIPDRDIQEEDIFWKAYRIQTERGVIRFDWDLVSGCAMLLIRRLPRGSVYIRERDKYLGELSPLIDLSSFDRVPVSRAVSVLNQSESVRRRQTTLRTQRGSRAAFTSATRASDTYDDPDIENASSALGSEAMGELGNYYWLAQGPLETEMHIKVYSEDERVGIFGQKSEQEVRYVLSRIRELCSG